MPKLTVMQLLQQKKGGESIVYLSDFAFLEVITLMGECLLIFHSEIISIITAT
jgi:hypothetical protein